MLSEKQRSEIKARCDAATPGRWQYVDGQDSDGPIHEIYNEDFQFVCEIASGHEVSSLEFVEEDGHFISHAKKDIVSLLAHIDEQDRLILQLRERLERAKRKT